MKKAILFFSFIILTIATIGQDVQFRKDDKVLNLGIGFGSTLYTGRFYSTTVPPVSVSFELGFMDDLLDIEDLSLGLGGYLGYTSSRYEYEFFGSYWGWDYKSVIIGARGVLHYPLVEKLDTYSGLMLGYNVVTSKSFGAGGTGSAAGSGVAYSWFAGGRYYFTSNLAGMVEIGYGIAYLNLGLAVKF